MSYSMSPPAQKPLPNPYPPYQQAASPQAQSPYAPPPAKRPRLSPDVRSPQVGASPYATSPNGMPNYGYGQQVQSPYSPSTSYAGSPVNSFNTPQPYQQQVPWQAPHPPPPPQQRVSQGSPPATNNNDRGQMPPPPRPTKDEKEGVDEISDSLYGSGINLKDEENYLHSTWNNRHGGNDSFATNQSTSFGSSTMVSGNSFNMLTQSTSFGSQEQNSAFAGTMGGPRTQEDIEKEAEEKRARAARAKAEKDQFPLNNQFLLGNCVRNRLQTLAANQNVRLDVQGVYIRNPEDAPKVMVNGAGTEGIAEVKPGAKIEPNVGFEHIISFLTLAGQERMRGLVDEAYGLARARQYGDHGRVVPPEFADIAEGQGKMSQETVVPESITGTQWDKSQDAPAEAADDEANPNGEKAPTPSAQTVSFQGSLNARLRELAKRDRKAEEARQRKREERQRKAAETGDGATPTDTPAETPAAAAPVDTVAPTKMSKKEQNKKAKADKEQLEASLNQANATASMQAFGRKKKYSWMTGGAAIAQNLTNRYVKPSSSGTATPKAQAESVAAVKADKEKESKAPTWGDWREGDIDGRGIQLRDWVLVLERDGREKKALQKAVNKLS